VRVRQRLRINSAIAILSVAVTLAMLLLTAYHIRSTVRRMEIADRLITAQFERLALRTDYLHTGSDRAREQVVAKYRQITDLLKSAARTFSDQEDRTTIDGLIRGHEAIGQVFRAIVANRIKSWKNGFADATARDVEDRMLSQLNIKIYEGLLLGSRLQESANRALLSSITIAGGGILLVLAIVGSAILINSTVLSRAVGDRIDRLHEGAAAIGNGNLDYQTSITGDDEFVELSNTFNTMAERLRVSYRALKEEVEARKEVEENLRLSENKFSVLFNRALFPSVLMSSSDWTFIDVNDAWTRLFGYSKKETLGKTAFELGLNRAADVRAWTIDEFLRHGQVLDLEQTLFRKSGEPVRVTTNLIMVTIAGKDYALISLFDITARKKAEEQVERHMADLRTANDELTRFNRLAVGRELRMIELKTEINSLRAELGRQPAYPPHGEDEQA
jgi:PAS domain S-box-containing protein